jgi:hypothetical protein
MECGFTNWNSEIVPLTVTVSVVLYPAWPWCADRETESSNNPATPANELNNFLISHQPSRAAHFECLNEFSAFRQRPTAFGADYIIAVAKVSMLLKGYVVRTVREASRTRCCSSALDLHIVALQG